MMKCRLTLHLPPAPGQAGSDDAKHPPEPPPDIMTQCHRDDGVIKDEDDDVDTSWQIFWPYSAPLSLASPALS